MKRFSMLMLLAAATYALTGCVVTDYPCITDTENTDYASGCSDAGLPEVHDTQGWAHILDASQTATDNNGDGIFTVFSAFVAQDTSGVHSLANVAFAAPNDPYQFHSDLYGQGATKAIEDSIWAYAIMGNSTWDGNNFPGRDAGNTGDITGLCAQGFAFDPFWFDYQLTTNCMAADGDLSTLTSYFTRTGEVGRSLFGSGSAMGVPLAAKLALLQAGEITEDGMIFTISDEMAITLTQGDYVVDLDLSALYGKQLELDPTDVKIVGNDLLAQAGIGGSDYLAVAEQFAGFSRQMAITATVTLFGQTFDVPFALAHMWDAETSAAAIDAHGAGGGDLGRRR